MTGIPRWIKRARLRARVVYAAARLRPLIVNVAINGGTIRAAAAGPIVLGEMTSIQSARIRSRMFISGNSVAVVNNHIDLTE